MTTAGGGTAGVSGAISLTNGAAGIGNSGEFLQVRVRTGAAASASHGGIGGSVTCWKWQ